MTEQIAVMLTKTGGDSGICLFGNYAKGSQLLVKVRDQGGEQENKIRARRMFERDYPDENQMEWEAEVT